MKLISDNECNKKLFKGNVIIIHNSTWSTSGQTIYLKMRMVRAISELVDHTKFFDITSIFLNIHEDINRSFGKYLIKELNM